MAALQARLARVEAELVALRSWELALRNTARRAHALLLSDDEDERPGPESGGQIALQFSTKEATEQNLPTGMLPALSSRFQD
eukprot:229411-Rhodomonas_salina.1